MLSPFSYLLFHGSFSFVNFLLFSFFQYRNAWHHPFFSQCVLALSYSVFLPLSRETTIKNICPCASSFLKQNYSRLRGPIYVASKFDQIWNREINWHLTYPSRWSWQWKYKVGWSNQHFIFHAVWYRDGKSPPYLSRIFWSSWSWAQPSNSWMSPLPFLRCSCWFYPWGWQHLPLSYNRCPQWTNIHLLV